MNSREQLQTLLNEVFKKGSDFAVKMESFEKVSSMDGNALSSTQQYGFSHALHQFLPSQPPPKAYDNKWPSYLMQLMNDNTDDEWLPVMDRIRTNPEEIAFKGKNGGQNAMHAACVRYPPLHVMEAMLLARPDCALVQNFAGETPLHLASFSASEEVQSLLIRVQPAAAAMVDQYGDCALHFAARQGATRHLLELLVKTVPQTIGLANNRGVTPFWLLPRTYVEADSMEEVFDEDEEHYKDDWNLFVLFLSYSYFGPSEAQKYGGEDDDYEWVVAAAASTPSCPRDSLKFVCRMFPDQALKYNRDGFTPLLLAVQTPEFDEPLEWDEVEDGYREHVEVSSEPLRNQAHQLPEEVVNSAGVDFDFLHHAVQHDDDSVPEEGKQSVVEILVEWSQASVMYPDREGRLPLGHALAHGKSWKTVRRLLAASPRTIECIDKPTDMYMFQLAAENSPELDTVYALVRSLPELIAHAVNKASSVATSESSPTEPPMKKSRV